MINKKIKSIRHLNNNNNRRLTAEDFIEKAKKVYGDEYTYKNTIFKEYGKPITITCKIHGNFKRDPAYFLKGGGCFKCLKEKITKRKTDKFIELSKAIHVDEHGNELYGYDRCIFTGTHNKVELFCKKHKKYFKVKAYETASYLHWKQVYLQ